MAGAIYPPAAHRVMFNLLGNGTESGESQEKREQKGTIVMPERSRIQRGPCCHEHYLPCEGRALPEKKRGSWQLQNLSILRVTLMKRMKAKNLYPGFSFLNTGKPGYSLPEKH